MVTKAIITSFKKFKAAWEKDSKKPENTILYYLIAALNLEKDRDKAESMMTVVISKKHCLEDESSPSGLKLGKSARYYVGQFLESKNNARSYVGGTPDNEYKIVKKALKLMVVRKKLQGAIDSFPNEGQGVDRSRVKGTRKGK